MLKRTLSGLFLACFLGVSVWIVHETTRAPALPVGSDRPALTLEDDDTTKSLTELKDPVTVIFFHSQCTYCRHEFDALERGLETFPGRRFVLVTGEDTLPGALIRNRWPGLAESERVVWAVVDVDTFKDRFGTLATPAIFVFDREGVLRKKFVGETKLGALRLEEGGGG